MADSNNFDDKDKKKDQGQEDIHRLLLMRMEVRRYREHLVAVRDRLEFLLTGKEVPKKTQAVVRDETLMDFNQKKDMKATSETDTPVITRALSSEELALLKFKKKRLGMMDNKSEFHIKQMGEMNDFLAPPEDETSRMKKQFLKLGGEELPSPSPSTSSVDSDISPRRLRQKNPLSSMLHSYMSMTDAFSYAKHKLTDSLAFRRSNSVSESQMESQLHTEQELPPIQLEDGMPWHKKFMILLMLYSKVPFTKASLKQVPAKSQLVIHPQSHCRAQWNLFVTFFMSIWVIVCPAVTAFQAGHDIFAYFLFCTMVFQLLDILMNGLTSIQTDKGVEDNPQLVLFDYFRSNSLVEFLCLLPYAAALVLSWVSSPQTPIDPLLLLLLNISMLVKMLETHLSQKYNTTYDFKLLLRRVGISVNPNLIRAAAVFWFMVMYCHFFACLFYIVGAIEGYPEESWISKGNYMEYDIAYRYTHAVFMVISFILCNGYGQQTIRNNLSIDTNLETWMAIFCNFIGAMINAALIASISALISSFDISGQLYKEKMDEMNEYLQYIRLDRPARRIIKEYFSLKYSHGKYLKQELVMKELNVSLQTAVAKHTCEHLILKVPFFRECGQQFISALVRVLTMTHILPGQYVVEQGSFGDEMFFIQSGQLEVIIQGKTVKVLGEGVFFGEVAVLLGHTQRSASIRAKSFSILYVLNKKGLDPILKNYPDIRERFLIIAEKRLEELAQQAAITARSASS